MGFTISMLTEITIVTVVILLVSSIQLELWLLEQSSVKTQIKWVVLMSATDRYRYYLLALSCRMFHVYYNHFMMGYYREQSEYSFFIPHFPRNVKPIWTGPYISKRLMQGILEGWFLKIWKTVAEDRGNHKMVMRNVNVLFSLDNL